MKFVTQLSDWVFNIEKILAMVISVVMLISLFLGVIFRYVLNSPLIWSDEVAIYSLVWLTFLGGSMAIKTNQSAAITILMDNVKGKTKKVLTLVSTLMIILFAIFMLYLCVRWLSSPTIALQYSNSMQMPMIYAYLSVPVGFAFILIHSLHNFLLNVKRNPEEVA